MVKKCFTINQFRTRNEINSYKILLEKNIFQGIEIFYPYDTGDEGFINYTKGIKELLKYNPEVVMHLPYGPKNDLCNPLKYEASIKRIKNAIDYSKEFNIKKFTLHLGYNHNDNREEELLHIKNILKDLCQYTSGTLMIENMPGIKEIGYSPKEILDIITSVNQHNLAFILDTGHANLSEYSINEYINTLRKYLMHIHVSDNNGKRDEHARIGTGNIDFVSFVGELKSYNELYCFEILYHDVNDLIVYSNDFDKIIKEVYDEKN